MKMVAYLRVSTQEQADSGLGLEAQQHAVEMECSRRDWSVGLIIEEHASVGQPRPELERALILAAGPSYDGLIVARLDRLGRSVAQVSGFIEDAVSEKWSLVSVMPNVDMTTDYGRAMAQMAVVFSELERSLIRSRTREALAAKKARGEPHGMPPEVPEEALVIIRSMTARGLSLRRIAARLDREGIPTPRSGGLWSFSTVRKAQVREGICPGTS